MRVFCRRRLLEEELKIERWQVCSRSEVTSAREQPARPWAARRCRGRGVWAADNRARLRRGARARGYRRGRRGGGRAGRPESQASPRRSAPARPKSLLLSNGVRCQVEQAEGVRGGVKGRADPPSPAPSRARGRLPHGWKGGTPRPKPSSSSSSPLQSRREGGGRGGPEPSAIFPASPKHSLTRTRTHTRAHTDTLPVTHVHGPPAGHTTEGRAAAEEAPRRRSVSGLQGGPALARTPPRPRPAPHPSGQLLAARAPGYSPSNLQKQDTRRREAQGKSPRPDRMCGEAARVPTRRCALHAGPPRAAAAKAASSLSADGGPLPLLPSGWGAL